MSFFETDHKQSGFQAESCHLKRILHQAFVIKKAYDLLWDDIAEQHGLTRIQVEVVAFLLNNPNMDTARDMVDYRLIAKSHVSKAVDKLLSEGFLTRQSDGSDRRCIHLALTEKAAPLAEKIQNHQKEFSAKLKEGITDREMACLYEIADRIVANAEKMI